MKKAIIPAVAAVLVVPSVALAKGPPSGKGPGSHGKAAPKVMYVLKGTLSGYSPASGSANGTLTITVMRSNRHGWALKGQDLSVQVSSATKIVLRHGASGITDGDRGIVKVRAPKNVSAADLASTLQATNAFQVVDQGVAAPTSGQDSGSGSHGKAAPKVMYVLKGTLSAYSAASGSANGTLTITVMRSNRHGWGLKGQSLTVQLSSATKVVLRNGASSISDGDRGIVKVRAPKNVAAADLASTLQATNAFQVVDQG